MKSPIPLPRFSLKTLFIAVLGVAIALAALKFANPIWASSLFTLLLVVLFAGFLGAVFGHGERRVFCAGLMLSGLGYLMAVYGPWFESHVSGHLATTHLLSYLHEQFQESVTVPAPPGLYKASAPLPGMGNMGGGGMLSGAMGGGGGMVGPGMGSMGGGMPGGGMGGMGMPSAMSPMMGGGQAMPPPTVILVGPTHADVMRVGHSLFGFIFALIGGSVARWTWLKSRQVDEIQQLRAPAST